MKNFSQTTNWVSSSVPHKTAWRICLLSNHKSFKRNSPIPIKGTWKALFKLLKARSYKNLPSNLWVNIFCGVIKINCNKDLTTVNLISYTVWRWSNLLGFCGVICKWAMRVFNLICYTLNSISSVRLKFHAFES